MEIVLLNDKKSIKQLVEVDVNKSILEFIEVELSKDEFNFIVTAENMPKAKKVMADLNKNIDFVTKFRKEKVNNESIDIDNFKSNVKEYVALIDKKRDEIKKNVEVFEREQKDKITKELSLYADEAIKNANLRYDFSKVDTADLIVLGSVTAKGSLTKKAKETIDGRVLACKSKQDKYDMRLLNLENESRKAGLEAILTITHVQGIIMLDDSEYERGLENLIIDEINRQHTIKTNLQEQVNREANQKVLDEQKRIVGIFDFRINFNTITISEIDEMISFRKGYDFDSFMEFKDFAISEAEKTIKDLEKHKMIKKQNENVEASPELMRDVVDYAKKENPVVHETIPIDTPKVEDGKKIVRINAIFEVEVPSHVPSDAVLNKVRSRLSECDINNDTLKSLEVD